MDINLIPFIAEAISTNKKTYKEIDKIYNKDKLRFIKLAKESEFYDHPMSKEGDIQQEYYYKKSLGIIKVTTEDEYVGGEFINVFKKGWRYTYTYVMNHKSILISNFMEKFIKKNKDIDNLTDNELNSNMVILITLSLTFKKNIDLEDEVYNNFTMVCARRLKSYEIGPAIDINKIGKEQLKVVKKLELKLKNHPKISIKMPTSYKLDIEKQKGLNIDIEKLTKDDKNFLPFEYIYGLENIFLGDIAEGIFFNTKDIQELIFAYTQFYKEEEINYDDFIKYIYPAMELRYLCKAYKKAKKYFFENFNEELFEEINKKDIENKEIKKSNILLQDENERLKLRVEELERENKKLKQDLQQTEDYKSEIVPLREFIFNLDTIEDFKEEDINYKKIEELNAVIIGGHQQWRSKMKEYLKNTTFIASDSLNFNTDILFNVDVIFVYTNYLNHGMYYKVIDIVRENNLKLSYLKANINEDIVLKQINKFIETV